MTTIEQYEVAIFNRAPNIGDINPEGEISYVGYRRVLVSAYGGTNLEEVVFPPSDQDDPVFASHVVVIDGAGRVVGVKAL